MKKFFNKITAAVPVAVMMCVLLLSVPSMAQIRTGDTVVAGGVPFGIKVYADGLFVAGVGDVESAAGSVSPARDAGIKKGDLIKKISGKDVTVAEEFTAAVESSAGPIELTLIRSGKETTVKVEPAVSRADGKKRLGIWLRDCTAGIGTVSFASEETGEFAGLGHGVCDAETGCPVELHRGTAGTVMISGVKRGEPGVPGELKGYFTGQECGVVEKNTGSGVFGVLSSLPHEMSDGESYPLGGREDVALGRAYILSTVGEAGREKFEVEVTSLGEREGKSFELRVTDERLIELTGGIVQGMSGSPIIQNGKLVGAVTHV